MFGTQCNHYSLLLTAFHDSFFKKKKKQNIMISTKFSKKNLTFHSHAVMIKHIVRQNNIAVVQDLEAFVNAFVWKYFLFTVCIKALLLWAILNKEIISLYRTIC